MWTIEPETQDRIDAILSTVELPDRKVQRKRKGQKLAPADVEVIRQALINGEENQSLAQRFGVSRTTISQIKYGTRRKVEKGYYSKLSVEQVRAIKNGLSEGVPGATLALLYNVSPSAISRIKNGSRWQEVP